MIPIEKNPINIILMNFGWIWILNIENIPDNISSPIIRYKPFIEELKAIQMNDPIKAKGLN